jgi:hypothetical protein
MDQFLTSAEEKWRIMNGLIMLLPHGFEGQGTRTFERPHGAISVQLCRIQYSGGKLYHACQFLSSVCAVR